MRAIRLAIAGAALVMAMPAGASAASATHTCPSFTYEGLVESHIVTDGATCAFIKNTAEHFYDDLKFPPGYSIRQEHPGKANGKDVVLFHGAEAWSFYISGHFAPDDS